jgi:hypothetical protein
MLNKKDNDEKASIMHSFGSDLDKHVNAGT